MSREVRLARLPEGVVRPDDFVTAAASPGELAAGEVRVATLYLSMDPVVRTRMTATPAMGPPIAVGTVVPGRGIGCVVESRDAALAPGSLVYGELGWRELATLPAAGLEVLPASDAPPRHHLNALGPTGLAAWFVVESLGLRAGETLFIAPAAGAVGSLAAQLALGHGARVIGTGVGAAQHDYLRGLGVEALGPDAAIETGIDAFVDGIGGALHDRVMARLNPRGRVVLLGFLSDYGAAGPPRYGSMVPVLMKRATVSGFLLADHAAGFEAARERLAALIASGALKPAETIWDGLEQAPHAFAALFGDAAPGKQLVKVGKMA